MSELCTDRRLVRVAHVLSSARVAARTCVVATESVRAIQRLVVVVATSLMVGSVCATSAWSQRGRLYLEPVSVGQAADSLVTVRLMLVAPGTDRIVSFHVVVHYDSTMMRSVRVDSHAGVQMANATIAGSIAVAGIAPQGFADGLLVTVLMRRARVGALANFRLQLRELTDGTGASLVAGMAVSGFSENAASVSGASGSAPAEVRIDSITPQRGSIERDQVLEIVMYGSGFASTGNTVCFGAAEAAVVPSERNGQRIRFIAPLTVRTQGGTREVPVTTGAWPVHVENVNGRSNRITFIVRERQ